MTPLMRVVRKRSIQPLLFAAAISLLATGCRTYEQQNRVIQYWHQGNLPSAAAEATKMADQNANNKDAIVWRLEQGAVLRGNGQCEASNKAFDQAQDRIDQYAQEGQGKNRQRSRRAAFQPGQPALQGRAYDGIMLNTYKALNYLQLGEPDKARVELIRAYQRQQDAVADNQRRIEKVQDEAAKSKDKATMDKAEQDPKFKSQMQGAYTDIGNLKAYANYVNPFTVYLDGLYFMADAVDASDLERARKSFERVVGFDPDNEYVKQDLATVDDLMNGKPLPPTTYVIFETGCAPVRDQIRIDIPIIVTKVSYVGAAFPTLKPQGDYLPSPDRDGQRHEPGHRAGGQHGQRHQPRFQKRIAGGHHQDHRRHCHQGGGRLRRQPGRQSARAEWAGLLMQIGTAGYQMAVNFDTRT